VLPPDLSLSEQQDVLVFNNQKRTDHRGWGIQRELGEKIDADLDDILDDNLVGTHHSFID
jgi:S-adenosylmethionine:tRNA-ribosyltransferase-isomerase (queuine synthetase)